MYPTNQRIRILRLLLVVLLLVTITSLVFTSLTVNTYFSSGSLHVITPDKDSSITVSQVNGSARYIGNGQTNVRLKPGVYLVGVAREGRSSTKVATVFKGKTTNINMSSVSTALLPTSADIDFRGTNSLLAHGMTNDQINNLRSVIFTYNKNTKTAIIDVGSITTPPFDPNSASRTFGLIFNLDIDGITYHATASWLNVDFATLSLVNPAGIEVYNSAGGHD